jgi:hypothetical protein
MLKLLTLTQAQYFSSRSDYDMCQVYDEKKRRTCSRNASYPPIQNLPFLLMYLKNLQISIKQLLLAYFPMLLCDVELSL